eukprot:TRINITY_DN1209_c2_g1_i2.p1 TRINITY_DN1209_c2_g1~~TRINITY_DN1209_c2_g1_i2.p1  ORF type:complete len:231 (-),score=82.28 TRINITY_DN1209_c2_g1_i2:261-953(-)
MCCLEYDNLCRLLIDNGADVNNKNKLQEIFEDWKVKKTPIPISRGSGRRVTSKKPSPNSFSPSSSSSSSSSSMPSSPSSSGYSISSSNLFTKSPQVLTRGLSYSAPAVQKDKMSFGTNNNNNDNNNNNNNNRPNGSSSSGSSSSCCAPSNSSTTETTSININKSIPSAQTHPSKYMNGSSESPRKLLSITRRFNLPQGPTRRAPSVRDPALILHKERQKLCSQGMLKPII